MTLENIVKKTLNRTSLTQVESKILFTNIMDGKIEDATLKKILINMSEKGETAEEITGGAEVLREKCLKINLSGEIIDTCGTGGDGKNTINISTASALLLAAMGNKVAKHGNKSVSSNCGSADVLEKLKIKIDLNPNDAEKYFKKNNFIFMFAPLYHSAMKSVANVRKELKKRTIFNLLGPLCNPANVNRQCIGVFSNEILEKYILVLKKLGAKKAWVFHSEEGLDEVSIFSKTKDYELNENQITSVEINPNTIIQNNYRFDDIVGKDSDYNAQQIIDLFKGKAGALNEIVSLNTAAGLIVLDKFNNLKDAYSYTKDFLNSGKAFNYLNELS